MGFEVEIKSPRQEESFPAYAAFPQGAKKGVVIIHEILGRQPEMNRVVDRFASQGYAAVLPDLFSKGLRFLCVSQMIQASATGKGPQVQQALLAREWICKQANILPNHVGLIGFCLGGGFALAIGQGWGAVSTNYGAIPPTRLLKDLGPVIGCYGGRDKIFGKTGSQIEAQLLTLGKSVETHTYPEVGHSFLTDGHHLMAQLLTYPFFRITYNPQVAEQAWEKIFTFFDRHLQVE